MRNAIDPQALRNTPAGRLKSNSHLWENQDKKSKYNNQQVTIDGHKFDSKREARHYVHLRQLLQSGEIRELKIHEVFQLSVCKYIADFTYYTKDGEYKVVDVKGFKTKEYLIKKKMMKSELGIEVVEVK